MHGIFYGGATRSLQLMLKSLQNHNIKKVVITKSIGAKEIANSIKQETILLKRIYIPTISNNQVSFESYEKAFNRISKWNYEYFLETIKKNEIDILHINSSVFAHIPRIVKEKISNVKIILHARELIPKYDDGKLQKYIIEEITSFVDKIICISDNEYEYFKHTNKAVIIPNPFDFSTLSTIAPELRKKYNINSKVILIGMLSHFSEQKGHLDFLKALLEMRKKNIKNEFKFVIIGIKLSPFWKKLIKKIVLPNNYEDRVINFIRQNELSDSIILVPYTNNPLNYISDLDIVVRPSLQADPWGRDIIEAMALSKPIVATGNSEFYIENNKTGFLVPPRDYKSLSEKIITLINNPELRIQMGEYGYKKVKKMCDINSFGKEIYNIYQELISS
ncbi:MAG: glycosyltransferase family 4 protein [Candidatus Woesearchaeota archaeon]